MRPKAPRIGPFSLMLGLLWIPQGTALAQEPSAPAASCEAIVESIRLPGIDVTERRRAVTFCRVLLPGLPAASVVGAVRCAGQAASFEALGLCAEQALGIGPEHVTPDLLCTAVAVGAPSGTVAERHALFDACRSRVRQVLARSMALELLRCLRQTVDGRACWGPIPPPPPRAVAESVTASGRRCRFHAPYMAAGHGQVVLYSCGSGDAEWPCYPRYQHTNVVGAVPGAENVFACFEPRPNGVMAVAVTDLNFSVTGAYAFDEVGDASLSVVDAVPGGGYELRLDTTDRLGSSETRIIGNTADGLRTLFSAPLTGGTLDSDQQNRLEYLGPGGLALIPSDAARAEPRPTRVYRWLEAEHRFAAPIECPDPSPFISIGVHPERIDTMDEWLNFATESFAQMPLAGVLGVPRVRRGPSYAAYPIAWAQGHQGCPAVLVRAVGYSQAPDTDAPETSYVLYGLVDTDPRTHRPRVLERRIAATDPRVAAAIARGEAMQAAVEAGAPRTEGSSTEARSTEPATAEVCNQRDDDADGGIDEGMAWIEDPSTRRARAAGTLAGLWSVRGRGQLAAISWQAGLGTPADVIHVEVLDAASGNVRGNVLVRQGQSTNWNTLLWSTDRYSADRLVLASVTRSYDCRGSGCPITSAVLDTAGDATVPAWSPREASPFASAFVAVADQVLYAEHRGPGALWMDAFRLDGTTQPSRAVPILVDPGGGSAHAVASWLDGESVYWLIARSPEGRPPRHLMLITTVAGASIAGPFELVREATVADRGGPVVAVGASRLFLSHARGGRVHVGAWHADGRPAWSTAIGVGASGGTVDVWGRQILVAWTSNGTHWFARLAADDGRTLQPATPLAPDRQGSVGLVHTAAGALAAWADADPGVVYTSVIRCASPS